MREIISSVRKGIPIIALVDPDANRGGLTMQQIRTQLVEAQANYERWDFDIGCPGADDLMEALFREEPIEWNRLSAFQAAAMRMIAERLISGEYRREGTYIDGQLTTLNHTLPPPRRGKRFHLYCSESNPGALELLQEELPRHYAGMASIEITTDINLLGECERAFLYLNAETWTRGEGSISLAGEVAQVMNAGLQLLMGHEMPSSSASHGTRATINREGSGERHGCEFRDFISNNAHGSTPALLLTAGIYGTLALPLMGGRAFREVRGNGDL